MRAAITFLSVIAAAAALGVAAQGLSARPDPAATQPTTQPQATPPTTPPTTQPTAAPPTTQPQATGVVPPATGAAPGSRLAAPPSGKRLPPPGVPLVGPERRLAPPDVPLVGPEQRLAPPDVPLVGPEQRLAPPLPYLTLPDQLARMIGFWRQRDPGITPDERYHWTVLPLVFANPLMGVGVGAAVMGGFRLGAPDTTSFSTFAGSGFVASQGQAGGKLRSDIRLPENGWILVGDVGGGRFPNPAFGLGGKTTAADGTIVDRRQFDFHENVYRRVLGDLYAGFGYWVDAFYDIRDEGSATGRQTLFSAYGIGTSGRSVSSGLTLNLLWEGRDSPVAPTHGSYLLVRYRFLPQAFGSDQDWASVFADGRTYLAIPGRDDVLAFRAIAWSSFGHTPYLLLPSSGADPDHRSGRGYVEGRWTGEDLLYGEVEYRLHIWEWLGAIAAVNLNAVSDRGTGLPGPLFPAVHPAAVLGLRALLSDASRSNLVFDVAMAPNGTPEFYLNANETF